MNKIFSTLLACATLLTAVKSQDQASTLAALCDKADVICKVRVLAVTGRDSQRLAVVFRAREALKGKAPGTFELAESGFRTCGQALYGMVPGSSYFAFLRGKPGEYRLAMANARTLVNLSPAIEDHLRALLRSRSGASRIAILAKALTSSELRIQGDAGLALTVSPHLGMADVTARAQLTQALKVSVITEAKGAPSLMIAAARLHLTESLDSLLPAYLAGTSPHLHRAMLNAIPQIDAVAAARRITAQLPADNSGRIRALLVLQRLPISSAKTAYLALLRGSSFGVTTAAGRVLLRAGMAPAELSQLTNKEVADASKGSLVSQRPNFRAVSPGASRR